MRPGDKIKVEGTDRSDGVYIIEGVIVDGFKIEWGPNPDYAHYRGLAVDMSKVFTIHGTGVITFPPQANRTLKARLR